MKKKIWAFILAFCVVLAGMGSMPVLAADDDGVTPYDPGEIVIPFSKVWEDNDNADGFRPESITVNLYRFKGDSYSDEDLYDSAVVTADMGWKYDFTVIDTPDDPAFYIDDQGNYVSYNFAVEEVLSEEAAAHYSEFVTAHKDPEIIMTALAGSEYWVQINPKNVTEYEIETDAYPKNFIAAKKGHELYIWTPEVISEIEQRIILQVVRTHNQYPHVDYDADLGTDLFFFTGFGHYDEGGFTMYSGSPGKIVFDAKSKWSFWGRGTYTRSTPEQNSASITNEEKTATVDVTVTKAWVDGENHDNIRPENVEVTLYVGEEAVAGQDPKTLSASNNWTGTWEELVKFDDQGNEIAYTVKETLTDKITGTDGPGTYAYSVSKQAGEDGSIIITVTNTHTPEITAVNVQKIWHDYDNHDGIRPGNVEVTLCVGEEAVADQDPITLSESNNWTGTWEELDKYDAEGNEIAYTVKETETDVINGEDADGTYAYAVENATGTDGQVIPNSFIVTNTHTPILIEVSVEKVWDDEEDHDGIRPETVDVELLINGEESDEILTLSEETDWTGTWEELEKYDAQGEEITYSVQEIEADVITGEDADGTYAWDVDEGMKDEDGNWSFTVTNTHTPIVIEVSVEKVWDDEEDHDGIRPETVDVELLVNGEESDEILTLSEETDWTGTWEELDKYDAEGNEIEYSVQEIEDDVITGEDADGTYAWDVDEGVQDEDGNWSFTVTNTHTPKTEATVKKVWDDNDNKEKKRPAELIVTLSDGTKVTLNEENSWTATVKDLPMYKDGEEIDYTWKEETLPEGYKLAKTKKEGTVTTLTNKLESKEEIITGDMKTILPYMIGLFASAVLVLNGYLLLNGGRKRQRRK